MRTIDIPNAKLAEDYSELEIFTLLSKARENNLNTEDIVFNEIKSNRLKCSAEEGMKLTKALFKFKMYNTQGNVNENV